MPEPEDEKIRESIQSILENLAEHPAYVNNLLDRFDKGGSLALARPLYDTWQIGIVDYTALVYRSVLLWRASGKSVPITLLKNGLLEELLAVSPSRLEEILEIVADHPLFISRRKSGFSIIDDLNDISLWIACGRNPYLVQDISKKLSDYISLPNSSELKSQSFEQLTLSIAHLITGPSVRNEITDLSSKELVEHIHELPALRKFTNSKKLFANAASHKKEFKAIVGEILAEDREIIDRVVSGVVGYTTLPVTKKDDLVMAQIVQENWEEMILSLVELGSTPNVRSKLKEFATEELVNDLYDLTAFKNAQYTRKLVADLANGNPDGFKDLVETILSRPYDQTLTPLTNNLLTYFSSTTKQVNENPKIASNLLDSLSKLAADPEISDKIAPLLNKKLVENVFETFELQKYESYKPVATELTEHLSRNPKALNSVIIAYDQYSKKGITEKFIHNAIETLEDDKIIDVIASDAVLQPLIDQLNSESDKGEPKIDGVLEAAPDALEAGRFEIIQNIGEAAYLSLKKMADLVKSLIKSKDKKEKQPLDPKIIGMARNFRKFAAVSEQDNVSILNIINKGQTKVAIGKVMTGASDNSNIKTLEYFGIKEDDLIKFANKACNAKGFNAIADYLESEEGISKSAKLAKIFIATGNIRFAVKHLGIGLGNYTKELFATKKKFQNILRGRIPGVSSEVSGITR